MSLRLRARLLLATLVVGVAIAGGTAKAQDGFINVAATVAASCSVVTDPMLDFGTYDASSHSEEATSFQVECSAGTSVDVFLDNGLHSNGSSRNLEHDEIDGEHLGYILYLDQVGGASWGTSEFKTVQVESGTPATVDVFGRITSGQDVASGSYSDTVGITLSVN